MYVFYITNTFPQIFYIFNSDESTFVKKNRPSEVFSDCTHIVHISILLFIHRYYYWGIMETVSISTLSCLNHIGIEPVIKDLLK